MNNLFHVLIFTWIFLCVNGARFDRYSGKEVDDTLAKELKLKNATEKCTIEIKPCTPHEGSRVDGTCNNYKYPSKGSARGPYLRLLPPEYGEKRNIRASRKGTPLPSARKVRTALQSTGRVDDKHAFNSAAVHFLQFIGRDVSALNGPLDYLKKRQNCCKPEGKDDPRCIPISVPDDDPYLKVTDIRCLNFSRAETFQDAACSPEIIPPEQINFQTPLLDLSTIYGVDDKSLDSVRLFKHGQLKHEERNGRDVPLNIFSPIKTIVNGTEDAKTAKSVKTNEDMCFQNTGNETTCYQFGIPEIGNIDLRTTTLTIFFMREHNRLAKALNQMNECWKDDRLFKVARQITVATAANIFMYELLPILLGYNNMVNYGLISDRVEHIAVYDEEAVPLVYAEYDIASRFFNTFLDGRIKRYDENYHYVGEFSLGETLFRPGLVEQDKNFEEINRGTFYQKAAKIDDIQDPEISENYYGKMQRAHDLAAIGLQRGRDLGVHGYNNFREMCGLKTAKNFEDLLDVMTYEKVHSLKKLYEEVEDVDLLAGIMSENFIKNTYVGPTLFCIMAKQLQLFRFADRFWFERGDQYHSLTLPQLHEIRKTNMARLACDNAEGIKFIQPRAFLNVERGNMQVPCTHIPGPDLSKWQDTNCYKNKSDEEQKQIKQKFGLGSQKTSEQSHSRDPKNMVMDYTTFFDSLLSYNDGITCKVVIGG